MGHGKSRAIDHRQFVQASSVAAAALALGATGCASSHPVAETGGHDKLNLSPGTYQATALGKKSDITVEVVFSDTAHRQRPRHRSRRNRAHRRAGV